ncbi:hypothetical protein EI982_08570 [Haloplanus rallus]|uniref:Transposase n=1 Tax=Haloplanus rallus TaxID=1816183 RepID=A0A6B9FDX7_9EURY|nr:hypothetical protein EI982_08570 [Haloplanus rallus]
MKCGKSWIHIFRPDDILPSLKVRASHPLLAGQVNPEDWESKVCWTVSQWLCHEAVGIAVKQVGSAYTSKRCAECGFTCTLTPV